eukprot:TRINITY_DN2218_c3_g1_i1.p1 TRINITY_DN2218_c3_g1~~TRINITY_DN2218_c3_g1_i1.p1  ORF type:complete len:630 (+),score=172.64 TRINITY_DN2218_c3_g1_i1:58-1890(+)
MSSPSIADSAVFQASRHGLSPNAQAFNPVSKPHKIMVAVGGTSLTVSCDLAQLRLSDLYASVADQMGIAGGFELMFGGNVLLINDTKALDVGIGNFCTVSFKKMESMAPMPSLQSPPNSDALQQLHLQQLQQQQQQLQAQKATAQLQAQVAQVQAQAAAIQAMAQSPLSPQVAQNLQYSLAISMNQMKQLQLASEYGLPMPSPANVPPMQSPANMPPLPPPQFGFSPPVTPQRSEYQHQSPQSPLGRDVGAASTGCINLSAVAGKFSTFALTAVGSRALVDALRTNQNSTETIEKIVDGMQEFVGLVTHKHGVDVMKELVDVCTPEQKAKLLEMACCDLVEICDSPCASEVLFQLIDGAEDAEVLNNFMKVVVSKIYPVMVSHAARKLIVKILGKSQIASEVLSTFFTAIEENLLSIATESKGCVVLKRCIDLAPPAVKESLQNKVLANCMTLISDQYGNYLVQHIIDNATNAKKVAELVSQDLVTHATNKMASHVIEKCLSVGNDDTLDVIVRQLVKPETMKTVIKDQYGNYIVQVSIERVPADFVGTLKDSITPFLADSQFGHKIEQKLIKRLRWVHEEQELTRVPSVEEAPAAVATAETAPIAVQEP